MSAGIGGGQHARTQTVLALNPPPVHVVEDWAMLQVLGLDQGVSGFRGVGFRSLSKGL